MKRSKKKTALVSPAIIYSLIWFIRGFIEICDLVILIRRRVVKNIFYCNFFMEIAVCEILQQL